MGQEKFEKNWREAFEGAEMAPSEQVWSGIEAAVANGEAAKYKRRAIYYKWAAAAGLLLFAGMLGYLSIESLRDPAVEIVKVTPLDSPDVGESPSSSQRGSLNNDEATSGNQEQASSNSQEQFANGVDADSRNTPSTDNSNTLSTDNSGIGSSQRGPKGIVDGKDHLPGRETVDSQSSKPREITGGIAANLQEEETNVVEGNPDENSLPVKADDNTLSHQTGRTESLNQLAAERAITPLKASNQSGLGLLESPSRIFGVALTPLVNKKPGDNSQLWAGLNLSPGIFDPNYRLQNDVANLADFDPPNSGFTRSEETNAGTSLSWALAMGIRISQKWELTSGVRYFRNNAQSSTNAVIDNVPVYSSVVESRNLNSISGSLTYQPTDLDNNFQFISIPLEAGYLVLDKKIQLSLNAGVAADWFLKNTISSTNQNLDRIIINPGSNSPYRSVYFNGLLGARASYEIMPRYSITLQPQYRVALNQFTKPNNSYSSLPSSVGLGVGIKYIFK